MTNPHRGEVLIDLGGKERVFRASLSALAKAEAASGELIANWLDKGMTINGASHLLVASCQDPILLDEVLNWADEIPYQQFIAAANEVFYMSIAGSKTRDRIFEELESKSKKNAQDGPG